MRRVGPFPDWAYVDMHELAAGIVANPAGLERQGNVAHHRGRDAIDAEVKAGAIKPREGVELLDFYEAVMREYTYIDQTPAAVPAAAVAPVAPERALLVPNPNPNPVLTR